VCEQLKVKTCKCHLTKDLLSVFAGQTHCIQNDSRKGRGKQERERVRKEEGSGCNIVHASYSAPLSPSETVLLGSLDEESGERIWKDVLIHGGVRDANLMLEDLLGRKPTVENYWKSLEGKKEEEEANSTTSNRS
jgi:hypothetical protein